MIQKSTCSMLFLAIILNFCSLYGCDSAGTQPAALEDTAIAPAQFGKVYDLKTHDLSWESTFQPSIAKSNAGTVYVLWDAKNRASHSNLDGIAKIPPEYLLGPVKREWNSVPGLSVLKEKKWLTPNVLVDGKYNCDPEYMWCQDDILHFIVRLPDDYLHHFVYDPKQNAWKKPSKINGSLDCSIMPRFVRHRKNTVHCLLWGKHGAFYTKYSENEWAKPLQLTPVASGYSRPRIAIAESGEVHVMWNYENKITHAIVKDTEIKKTTVDPAGIPIDGHEFDIVALSSSRILLAYKAHDEVEENADALYIREWDRKKWSKPEPVIQKCGLNSVNSGALRLLSFGNSALVSWYDGTVSYMVRGADRKWSKPELACEFQDKKSPLHLHMLDMPDYFYSIYVDNEGFVHMAWGSHTDNFYSMVTRLPKE